MDQNKDASFMAVKMLGQILQRKGFKFRILNFKIHSSKDRIAN